MDLNGTIKVGQIGVKGCQNGHELVQTGSKMGISKSKLGLRGLKGFIIGQSGAKR